MSAKAQGGATLHSADKYDVGLGYHLMADGGNVEIEAWDEWDLVTETEYDHYSLFR